MPNPVPIPTVLPAARACHILSLDGGGAKGFYTLGVLREVEALVKPPLCDHFDLIYGTSTGAVIAALLGLGQPVAEIMHFYRTHVPALVHEILPPAKSAALKQVVAAAFGQRGFSAFKTSVGIVATDWSREQPGIFRTAAPDGSETNPFGGGFGCKIADAVEASCSAFPFFERLFLTTATHGTLELADGSYCANNPVIYAIAEALEVWKRPRSELRVLSLGVGTYPEPSYRGLAAWIRELTSARLAQKMLNVTTASTERLRQALFTDVATIRINDVFSQPKMAIDLMEANLEKLDALYQEGRDSFARRRTEIAALLLEQNDAPLSAESSA